MTLGDRIALVSTFQRCTYCVTVLRLLFLMLHWYYTVDLPFPLVLHVDVAATVAADAVAAADAAVADAAVAAADAVWHHH